MIEAWRIADPTYSSTPESMMSGQGAFLHGGRWNSAGVRVVYLGSSLAQAAMELLVHLGRSDVLSSYNKMPVHFDEALIIDLDLASLPDDWAEPSMTSAAQATGDLWVKNGDSPILQVPSVAVPGASNFLFNPDHPEANEVQFGEITPFRFDPRLLK